MGFESLGKTLERPFRGSPIRPALLALKVEKETQKHLPAYAKFISFREGRITLATPSPAHSQELYLQGRELIKKVNESLGGKAVEDIRLRIKNPS